MTKIQHEGRKHFTSSNGDLQKMNVGLWKQEVAESTGAFVVWTNSTEKILQFPEDREMQERGACISVYYHYQGRNTACGGGHAG